jgi:hypothetical protein
MSQIQLPKTFQKADVVLFSPINDGCMKIGLKTESTEVMGFELKRLHVDYLAYGLMSPDMYTYIDQLEKKRPFIDYWANIIEQAEGTIKRIKKLNSTDPLELQALHMQEWQAFHPELDIIKRFAEVHRKCACPVLHPQFSFLEPHQQPHPQYRKGGVAASDSLLRLIDDIVEQAKVPLAQNGDSLGGKRRSFDFRPGCTKSHRQACQNPLQVDDQLRVDERTDFPRPCEIHLQDESQTHRSGD